MSALYELERVNSRDFWASETNDGMWDVQLSESVVVYSIKASSVTEAVRIARWKSFLDKSIKKIDTCDTSTNVF
jgi:predicted RNA-binding protein